MNTKNTRDYGSGNTINVPALQKAENDARRMSKNTDEDLSHIGEVIERITNRLIQTRREKRTAQITDKGTKKRFYTSADASAKDD